MRQYTQDHAQNIHPDEALSEQERAHTCSHVLEQEQDGDDLTGWLPFTRWELAALGNSAGTGNGWCDDCGGSTDRQDGEGRMMGVDCRCGEGEMNTMLIECDEPELNYEEQSDDFANGRYCRGGYPCCECAGTNNPICDGELQSVIDDATHDWHMAQGD